MPAPAGNDPPAVIVIGVGNILLGDEGLGVRAVQRLATHYVIQPAVDLVDGGTCGMDLIEMLAGRDLAIVLDAMNADAPPGTLLRLDSLAPPTRWQSRQSRHQTGLAEVLAALTLLEQAPEHLTVLGMVPADLNLGLDLSPTVAAGLDALVEEAVAELRRHGFDVRSLEPAPAGAREPSAH